MEIPVNDNIKNETAEFERVVKLALEDIRKDGYCWINSNALGVPGRGNCCGELTAKKVVSEFMTKGYHVRKAYNLVGRWMNYTISKKELTAGNYSEVLC